MLPWLIDPRRIGWVAELCNRRAPTFGGVRLGHDFRSSGVGKPQASTPISRRSIIKPGYREQVNYFSPTSAIRPEEAVNSRSGKGFAKLNRGRGSSDRSVDRDAFGYCAPIICLVDQNRVDSGKRILCDQCFCSLTCGFVIRSPVCEHENSQRAVFFKADVFPNSV